MPKITEVIPDDAPQWVWDGIEKGQLFRIAINKVESLEREKVRLKSEIYPLTLLFCIVAAVAFGLAAFC